MITFELNPHQIKINFDRTSEYYLILGSLYFYVNEGSCFITKILIVTEREGVKWYSDVTDIKSATLLHTHYRLRMNKNYSKKESTHISFSENLDLTTLEIHTLNRDNVPPVLPKKDELAKILSREAIEEL